MFKSGKSVRIESRSFRSKAGVLVAPSLNIHGLVINSNNTIPKEVVDFFKSKGAKIELLEEDGDKLVRLTGSFNISSEEVQKFLKAHGELMLKKETKETEESKYQEESKVTTEALNFQRQVAARLKALRSSSVPNIQVGYSFSEIEQCIVTDKFGKTSIRAERTQLYTIIPTIISSEQTSRINAGSAINVGTALLSSGMATNISAGEGISISSKLEETTGTGFLSEITSGELTIRSGTGSKIENTVVQSAGSVEMTSGGDVVIGYEHDGHWVNSPTIPSLVFAYDAEATTSPSTIASPTASVSTVSTASSSSGTGTPVVPSKAAAKKP